MIIQAENAWLDHAREFVNKKFSDVFLPSHDLDHHLRTWEHAKKLLLHIHDEENLQIEIVEGLLLASMFHDTGMVKTISTRHGAESARIYAEYIAASTKHPPVEQEAILRAIENHDVKTYDLAETIHPGQSPDLLKLLRIADDLDALGAIGIYRYAEIYLLRKIPLKDAGEKIMENVQQRYSYFLQSTLSFPSLQESYRTKYNDIITFMEQYNMQIKRLETPEKTFAGPIGVFNHIRRFISKKRIRPQHFLEELSKEKTDIFTNAFFHKLHHELHQ